MSLLNAGSKGDLARQLEPQLGPTTVLVTSGTGQGFAQSGGYQSGDAAPRTAAFVTGPSVALTARAPDAAATGLDLRA